MAELEPPSGGRTSWDFSLIDPLVEDFVTATRGRSPMLNFSTVPEWMWQPPSWMIQKGALHVVGGDNAIAANGPAWTDYTFSADVTPLATGPHGTPPYTQAGWLVRMQDRDNGYWPRPVHDQPIPDRVQHRDQRRSGSVRPHPRMPQPDPRGTQRVGRQLVASVHGLVEARLRAIDRAELPHQFQGAVVGLAQGDWVTARFSRGPC